MIDPVQAAVGIVTIIVVVGAFLYLFYSRTNAVEKTGYGALIMLAGISLMIPIFWILESNGEAIAMVQQHTLAVERGAELYAQYCYQCHGTKGQGRVGPKLNGNAIVNKLNDQDLLRIISAGVYDTADLTKPMMPAWSDLYGGPLDDNDIQYLFALIRSADPQYLSKNGYPSGSGSNGFSQVASYIQNTSPSTYATAVAQETSGQFGTAVDMTKKSAITINITSPTNGQTCNPDCYTPVNIKVKVGTTITWINQTSLPHTVTAIKGTDLSAPAPDPQIFDSGLSSPLGINQKFTWKVTMDAYNLHPDHTVIYFCEIHPGMVAELTIVP